MMLPVLALSLAGVLFQGQAGIAQLQWLSGCWEMRSANRIYTEQWMRPEGGLMMGMSRTVVGGKATEFEFLQIRQDEAGLSYVARPSGQPEASFRLVRQSDREMVFENPQHDFPTRILYRLQADGSLVARIEGKADGKERGIDFPMKRAMCP